MKRLFQVFYSSEVYTHGLELRATRLLWFTVGACMSYAYFSSYSSYCHLKQAIFQSNYPKIHEKYQQMHYSASNSRIDFQGFPDNGDWLFTKELPEPELNKLVLFKRNYEDKRNEFCFVLPLYILGGLWSPVLSAFLGGSLMVLNKRMERGLEGKTDQERPHLQWYRDLILAGLVLNSFGACFGLRFVISSI